MLDLSRRSDEVHTATKELEPVELEILTKKLVMEVIW
jgi:hypothetical protein